MTAIDAAFGEVSFDRGRNSREGLLWLLPWSVALVFGAGLGAWVMHARPAAAPDLLVARSSENPAAAAAGRVSNPYGALGDAGFFGGSKPASRRAGSSAQATLEAALDVVAARSAAQLASALSGKISSPYGALDLGVFPRANPASSLQASLEAAPSAPTPAPPVLPPPPKREVAAIEETAPLPPARPAELAPPAQPERRAQPANAKVAVASPPADDGNIFSKLFGLGRSPGSSAAVAYAAPESRAAGGARVAALAATDRSSGFSLFARSAPPPGYDKYTAVYDISARVVYMPDGTRLEAHSGLGDRLDDPRFVNERARGATPPHLYELTPREELFHGVQALRLNPIGDGDLFGRAGLLAHPFMLGPNGDSNGCVSFADYDAFLRAYQQGQVKRLAVVARLD